MADSDTDSSLRNEEGREEDSISKNEDLQPQPLQLYQPNLQSWVWKHFQLCKNNKDITVCNDCEKQLTYTSGSTSGMSRHLENTHRICKPVQDMLAEGAPSTSNVRDYPVEDTESHKRMSPFLIEDLISSEDESDADDDDDEDNNDNNDDDSDHEDDLQSINMQDSESLKEVTDGKEDSEEEDKSHKNAMEDTPSATPVKKRGFETEQNSSKDVKRKKKSNYATPSPGSTAVKIGLQNVNGLNGNPKREHLCNEIIPKYDIFVVEETKLTAKTKSSKLEKDSYQIIRQDRVYEKTEDEFSHTRFATNWGGGILIYVKTKFKFKERSRCEYAENNVQFLHIEITYPISLHLVAIYSPLTEYYTHVCSIIEHFLKSKPVDAKIMFIGDYNIDMKRDKREGNQVKSKFSEFNISCCKDGKHEKFTFDGKTKSCVDHIQTNANVTEFEVIDSETDKVNSDHHLVYCVIEEETSKALSVLLHRDACTHITEKHLLSDTVKYICSVIDSRESCLFGLFGKVRSIDTSSMIATNTYDGVMKKFICRNEIALCFEIKTGSEQEFHEFMTRLETIQNMIFPLRATIFSRIVSEKFKTSQQRMWGNIRSEADNTQLNDLFVWRPRQVEFLGHILEPTMTYVMPLRGVESTIPDLPASMSWKNVELRHSLYRYYICRAKGCTEVFKSLEVLKRHEADNDHYHCNQCRYLAM